MSSVRIREANAADAEGIASVHVRAWQAAYGGLLPEVVIVAHACKRHGWWASYLEQPDAREHVLVALADERIAGFASTGPNPDEDAEGAWPAAARWVRGAAGLRYKQT